MARSIAPGGGLRALPDQLEQFALSFLPFERRTLRRDALHLFNILSKVYVADSDERYHPIPYADLTLPPITLREQRAAMAKLRDDGGNAPAQAKMFEAVLDQRALVDTANSRTKATRRSVQRRNDAANAATSTTETTALLWTTRNL